ncbi:MAG: EAL domain-containing protein [Beijerinckiaceae bacterium]|nr:EAL domain-containing protein [Beijerinckiaceae bacterium]
MNQTPEPRRAATCPPDATSLRSKGRLTTFITAGVVLSCLFVLAMTVWADWKSRDNVLRSVEDTTNNLALLIKENVTHTFRSIEMVMDLVPEPALLDYASSERVAMAATLAKALNQVPFIKRIDVIDPVSKKHLFGFDRGAGALMQRPDLADASIHPARRLLIGKPYRTSAGEWRLEVARGSGQELAGVFVIATVDLDAINRSLAMVETGSNGASTLFREDGIVLARNPSGGFIGHDLSKGTLFVERLKQGPSGTFRATSAADGVERITSYRHLAGLGLVVVNAFSEDHVLEKWRQQAILDAFVALSTAAIIIALGRLLLQAVERTSVMNAELTKTTELLQATLDNIDQGLLMIDADGIVAVHNKRFNELLDMDEAFTRTKPHYIELRRRLIANEEYAHADPVFQQWVSDGTLIPVDAVYQRVRPNGTVLEVRSVSLPGGGAVRTYTDITARKTAERDLEESEARYRLLSENASDLIVLATPNRRRRYVSPAVTQMLGYRVDEALDLTVKQLAHPDDVDELRRTIRSLGPEEPTGDVTYRMRRKDGSHIWVEAGLRHVKVEDGDGVVCVIRDVSKRRVTELELAEKSALLQATLDNMDQGLLMLDAEYRVQICNRRALELLDLPAALMEAKPHLSDVTAYQFKQGDFATSDEKFIAWVKSGGIEEARQTYERERPNGCVLEVTTTPIATGGAIRTYSDITERKMIERQVVHASRHDVLTDLPNRLLFRETLDRYVAETRRSGRPFAVLYIDLDRFKAVNDNLGHHVGDKLLQAVTTRLRTVVRAEDSIARLGGDEFAVIQGGIRAGRSEHPAQASEAAAMLAGRLIDALDEPFILEGHSVKVGASIGISVAPDNGIEAEQLLRSADLALYRAKGSGRNIFRFFQSDMDTEIAARRALELDLRLAIQHGQFELVYQPVMSIADGCMTACEALLRWNHPLHGSVSRGIFIPLAEETGLIVPIGEWVLKEACMTAAGWGGHIGIAVNVSTVQFNDDLVEIVAAALALSGLAPDKLEIEITESVLMQQGKGVLEILHRIRALGVRIALDDFGTGFSSLSYLRRFPLDTIKIDQSFVREIEDPKTSAIIDSIINLGERFSVNITAEGVETVRELKLICEKGCTHVQGYLLSHPISAAQIQPFMQTAKLANVA